MSVELARPAPRKGEGTAAAFRVADRRCASPFLGPRSQGASLARRRADDPVPLRRLRRHQAHLPAGRLPPRRARASTSSRPSTSRPSGTRAIPSARRAGCTRWRRGTACPTPWSRRPGSTARTWPRCWRKQAAFPLVQERAPQADGCGAAAGRQARRAGLDGLSALAPGLRPARRGTGCTSTCRRPGGTSMPRPSSPATFRATTIIVNHTGLPADRSPEGLAGWRRAMELLARAAQCDAEDLGPRRAGPALDVRAAGPRGARRHPHLRGGAVHVRLQLPGRFARCHLR